MQPLTQYLYVIGILKVEKVNVLERWLPGDLGRPQYRRQLFQVRGMYHQEPLVK